MAEKPEKDAQFTIRLPQKLKDDVWESAKNQDIDGVVWIRHAIREKLERERNPISERSDLDLNALVDQLRPIIKEVVIDTLKEANRAAKRDQ